MQIEKTSLINFNARIKLMKPDISPSLLKTGGSSSVAGGISSIFVGSSSGADMIVHGSDSAVPFMQELSSLFDQFAQSAHKLFNLCAKNIYQHGAYDNSFFSIFSSGAGSYTYGKGMDNIIEAIQKNYSRKIPS